MSGFFARLRTSAADRDRARALYVGAVERARNHTFYADFEVPDTLDGRFDMIAVHVFLILHRLKRDSGATKALSQAIFDVMFDDMDESLREMGVGDLSVGRRVKTMAKALYGRISAYDKALQSTDSDALDQALRRNVYRGQDPAAASIEALAQYVRSQSDRLAAMEVADIPDSWPDGVK